MDWVVFSFSRGSRAGFAFNRNAVFRETRDKRDIFRLIRDSRGTGNLVGDSSTAIFKKDVKITFGKTPVSRFIPPVSRKARGKSARIATAKSKKTRNRRILRARWSETGHSRPLLHKCKNPIWFESSVKEFSNQL